MRHKVAGGHLAHSMAQHKANMQNMAASLFQHELIRTTLAKAKALRSVAEPLITRAKTDTVANRRIVFARLRDRDMVQKLFKDLGPRYAKRAGGYTRVLRCGFRPGDKAAMAYVELVDRPQAAAAPVADAPVKGAKAVKAEKAAAPAKTKKKAA